MRSSSRSITRTSERVTPTQSGTKPTSTFLKNDTCEFDDVHQQQQQTDSNVNLRSSRVTILLVLFTTLNTKQHGFQKYMDGLRRWLVRAHELGAGTSIQLFTDSASSEAAAALIASTQPSVPLRHHRFSCPPFLMTSGNNDQQKRMHRSLFATLVRFFPLFDYPGSTERLGHRTMLMDVEPTEKTWQKLHTVIRIGDVYEHRYAEHPLNIMYNGSLRFDFMPELGYERLRRQHKLPYSIAQTFCVYDRLPRAILDDFLVSIMSGGNKQTCPPGRWVYGPMRDCLDRGVDEVFLNQYVLAEAVKRGLRVGYMDYFTIADPFYYYAKRVMGHSDSPRHLAYILRGGKADGGTTTVKQMLAEVDRRFYYDDYTANPETSSDNVAVTRRFWEVMRRAPDWLPPKYVRWALERYDGKTRGAALVVMKGGELERIMYV